MLDSKQFSLMLEGKAIKSIKENYGYIKGPGDFLPSEDPPEPDFEAVHEEVYANDPNYAQLSDIHDMIKKGKNPTEYIKYLLDSEDEGVYPEVNDFALEKALEAYNSSPEAAKDILANAMGDLELKYLEKLSNSYDGYNMWI